VSASALAWIDEALADLEANALHRTLVEIESPPGPVVRIAGRSYLCFASNDYLGLAADDRLRRGAVQAIDTFGSGAGGSRLITGNSSLHRRLERELAALKGCEDAVVFAAGYLANLGTISALVGRGDAVFSDVLNHASIIDGCRLSGAAISIYPHGDVQALAALLAESTARRRLIVTDSVFSMDGDLAPLPELVQLAAENGAMLMVDEAHATGVLGENGGGAVEHFGLSGSVPIVMGTLSKALGAQGAFVAGDAPLIDYLRNRARAFVFTTALAPPAVGAALAALAVVRTEPERRRWLRALAAQLREGLRALGYRVPGGETAIVPVLVGEVERALALSAALRQRGIFVPAIRPPTVPPGRARLRLSLSAAHTEAQVQETLAAFAAVRELVPC
jgi:8-amino-7-oxononanoate synthase